MQPAPPTLSRLATRRPPAGERRFASQAVEALITDVAGQIADPELAWLFENCFPNTLDTTVDLRRDADGAPDTCVITGDIDAMWLRDSAAQVWPCLPLARHDASLRDMLAGVVRRQARCVLLDPYANAFHRDPVLGRWSSDITTMKPGVHERKWELDSLAYFLRLSHGYWRATDDLSPFDATWNRAVALVVTTLLAEQEAGEDPARSPYSFERRPSGRDVSSHHCKAPGRNCGLIRCSFRPSDDMVRLPFLVPANAMLCVALRDIAPLLKTLSCETLAVACGRIAGQIADALEAHAVVEHPQYGEIWAYETDARGGAVLMDDANAPSLLSLPYFGFCAPDDPRYLRTRAFCLGPDNPSHASGTAGAGIGSPHTGPGTIWPLSLAMQALTSTDDDEILACLRQLKITHAGTGFMHESFRADDANVFTRPWFAWANTLFGELIVTLFRQRPHLLRASVADATAAVGALSER